MTRWLLALLLLSPAAVAEIELQPLHGLKADVATLILSGREGGALRAAVVATPGAPSAADASQRVAIWVEVDGASFFPESSPRGLPESIQPELHVYAMTPSGELAASLGYSLTLPVAELLGSHLKVATHLDLPPDLYQLHVLVREPRSQRFALRLVPLDLGAPDTTAAAEAPALQGAWLVAPSPDAGETSALGNVSASGLFAWKPLERLPAGGAAEPSESPAIELLDRGRTAKRVRAAAGAYCSALDRLASGHLDSALDRLREIEREVEAQEEPVRAWGWLVAAQDRVIRELAKDDPESLLPLLVLHMGGLDRTAEEDEPNSLLTSSARHRIVDLATAYGENADTDLAPALAAAALADIGVSFVRERSDEIARRFLDSALALDGDNTETLFCQAFVDERNGRYAESVDALRRALALAPDSEEGRLRLALALRRLGRSEEAATRLRQLIAEASEDWLLTIAYQELARLLLEQEGPEAAAKLLEQGLSRLPQQQRLHTQLSYLLDRAGERQKGHAVLAEMPVDSGRPSPRGRYGEPQCDESGSRELLLRHSTARLPVLAEALERLRDKVCR